MPEGPHYDRLTDKIAIDCEMMRSNIGQVLGRVSLINYDGAIVFDTFVCYSSPVVITSTNEDFSGITWNDIDPQNGAQTFSKVQTQLLELLANRIVIGHDVQKDLEVISLDLPSRISRLQGPYRCPISVVYNITTRDTQKCREYRQYAKPGGHQGPSLKDLARSVLHRGIKQGRVSSVEDAIATMELYRNAEVAIEQQQGN